MSFLEVEDLKKSFGATEVLKGVSFSLERGEVVSVIGPSGNGKTTLLRCLNLLEIADGGRIYIDKKVVFQAGKKYNESELRRNRSRFGLVFQGFNLFPQYTALKNVSLALDIKTREEFKAQKRKKAELKAALKENARAAEELLIKVGLADKTDNYPYQLSGGQCQRVAIARALALKPDVLCFDEPTSALDPELTGEVLKVIKSLKGADRAMIIVTHEMKFAADVSDKIIFMSDGAVAESGTPDEVFSESQNQRVRTFIDSVSH